MIVIKNIMKGSIYALIDPTNNNVRYIGKTMYPEKRKSRHFRKTNNKTHKEKWVSSLLAKNIIPIFKILVCTEECNLNNCEIEYIKHYSQFVKLTNGTKGGDGGSRPQTEKVKERMRTNNPMYNKETVKQVALKNIGKNNKPVDQYDLNGNFIKKYDSAKIASIELKIHASLISKVCKNKGYKKTGGFIWKYSCGDC